MANTLEEYTTRPSVEMPRTAGTESTAKTKSES
jgi:hypothetical protein